MKSVGQDGEPLALRAVLLVDEDLLAVSFSEIVETSGRIPYPQKVLAFVYKLHLVCRSRIMVVGSRRTL